MKELDIIFDLQSPQEKNTKINISINNEETNLLYKYIIGCNGTWTMLRDFSYEKKVQWTPQEDGKYIIMVQAKKRDSNKSFEYLSKFNYIVGKVEENLINSAIIDKSVLYVGEKFNLVIDTNRIPLMFRYWTRVKDKWEIIKDYSAENNLCWTGKDIGKGEILVECKDIDSKNAFDDFKTIKYEILPLEKVEIEDFKCLTPELIKDEEIMFKVDTCYKDGRTILYKFIKINSKGESECVQDYSTKCIVSYKEHKSGDYRLLCMVKDMYSNKQFDDRAVINFTVKKYRDIYIRNFTSDLSSPQLNGSEIVLKADVVGGKELLYRYIINGSLTEDSGYLRTNTYTWKSELSGKYNIALWVKDKSFHGNYECCEGFNFVIDEKSKEPIKIEEVIMDKPEKMLKKETVEVKVNASGGNELRYSFIIKKHGRKIQEIKYGRCSWIKFTPEEKGFYEIEARIKDKYSTREFDCHSTVNLEVFNYIPASIDYILFPCREYYVVGDTININLITKNTNDTLINYVLRINGHKVEETDFVKGKKYIFIPKCSGMYTIEVYAKNIESDKIFDCKKEVKVKIHEATPVTNTKIESDKDKIFVNEYVTFSVTSEGGKDVIYEFYIMEKGEWRLVQNYSKKNYYTFMAFSKDEYKILVLAKSQYYKDAYEDYNKLTFNVE